MRLQLTDFGRIRSADLDIRPLTVFVGDNGTNKSWAAYALHGLLRMVSRQPGSLDIGVTAEGRGLRAAVTNVLARSNETGQTTTYATPIAREARLGVPQETLVRLLALGAGGLSEGADARIEFALEEFPYRVKELLLERVPDQRTLIATATDASGKVTRREYGGIDAVMPELAFGRLNQLAMSMLNRVVVLPAERKAIVALGGIDLVGALLGRGAEHNALPLVWLDFIDMFRAACASNLRAPLADLSPLLDGLAGGTLHAVEQGPVVVFQSANGPALPLHGASSMARAVAGLQMYLAKLATPGDVVIIDELEMNAHPGAQLALVELVAMMVRAGLRVVFTTHSPYIVDQLNNLMAASRVAEDAQEELAKQFALKSKQAFIAPEDVAAYRFMGEPDGSVKVEDVLDRDRGRIRWSTFSEVSDRLSRLYDAVEDAALRHPAKSKGKSAKASKNSRGSRAG